MAGVKVDTALMQATAQQGATIADNMLTQAKTLVAGLEFARNTWTGAAGDAFRATTNGQDVVLNRLITRLTTVVDQIKVGGQGFEAQEASAKTNLTAQGQTFLSGPTLNA